MNNLTLLETIFIWYVIVVNVLGIINVFLLTKAPRDVGEAFLFTMIVIAVPILMPFVLYYTFIKIRENKRIKDLEKQFDEMIKEKDK